MAEPNGGAGSYSMLRLDRRATISPGDLGRHAEAEVDPDVTPPAVITLPSLTMRACSYVAPTKGSSSVKAQRVVARRPGATPRMNAPVHTDVTYYMPAA